MKKLQLLLRIQYRGCPLDEAGGGFLWRYSMLLDGGGNERFGSIILIVP